MILPFLTTIDSDNIDQLIPRIVVCGWSYISAGFFSVKWREVSTIYIVRGSVQWGNQQPWRRLFVARGLGARRKLEFLKSNPSNKLSTIAVNKRYPLSKMLQDARIPRRWIILIVDSRITHLCWHVSNIEKKRRRRRSAYILVRLAWLFKVVMRGRNAAAVGLQNRKIMVSYCCLQSFTETFTKICVVRLVMAAVQGQNRMVELYVKFVPPEVTTQPTWSHDGTNISPLEPTILVHLRSASQENIYFFVNILVEEKYKIFTGYGRVFMSSILYQSFLREQGSSRTVILMSKFWVMCYMNHLLFMQALVS